jgi:hypothetical protein
MTCLSAPRRLAPRCIWTHVHLRYRNMQDSVYNQFQSLGARSFHHSVLGRILWSELNQMADVDKGSPWQTRVQGDGFKPCALPSRKGQSINTTATTSAFVCPLLGVYDRHQPHSSCTYGALGSLPSVSLTLSRCSASLLSSFLPSFHPSLCPKFLPLSRP